MSSPDWRSAWPLRDRPRLTPSALDLWLVDLDRPAAGEAEMLSDDERERAARFVFPRDAAHFIAARSALRMILSAYLACRPGDLEFVEGRWGKPALAASYSAPLDFNLAHSGGLALIGVGEALGLGVDLELMRPIPDWRDIASQNFTPGEVASILALPAATQAEAFFACWTRKEAVIKLWGEGLSADLQSFEVSTHPDGPAELLKLEPRRRVGGDIGFWSLRPAENFMGAVAAQAAAKDAQLRFWRLA